ncbi:MAG: phospholipase D-like domain-containing protein [Vicinamibacterales bacterium]
MARSPVRRGFVIVLSIAAVVALGLLLAQDQETLRPRSVVSAEDTGFPEYLAALVGADVARGNRYEVFTNGDQFFPAMLAAINQARTRISFETYIYDEGAVAGQFTTALEQAAQRGVRCQITVDSVGASNMEQAHVDRLRSAGCAIIQFNPPHWYSLEELNYRTHRKILVIDGEIAFTGGAGIADHWLGHAQDPEHWRDTQVRATGPIARLLEGSFYENVIEAGMPVAPLLDDPQPPADDESPTIVVSSSPSGGSNDLKRLYLVLIASAKKTLDITTPYFVTDESSTWVLDEAVKRGVKVRILVEGDETDAMPVKYASRQTYDGLLSMGIAIYEYQPTMMHTKSLVVDGVVSMFGSANFDNRSLELNDELNVTVANRDLAARLTRDLEEDLTHAKLLRLDEWRQRSLLEKTREHFWSYFGEIF